VRVCTKGKRRPLYFIKFAVGLILFVFSLFSYAKCAEKGQEAEGAKHDDAGEKGRKKRRLLLLPF
jgi:hypothetical protein